MILINNNSIRKSNAVKKLQRTPALLMTFNFIFKSAKANTKFITTEYLATKYTNSLH